MNTMGGTREGAAGSAQTHTDGRPANRQLTSDVWERELDAERLAAPGWSFGFLRSRKCNPVRLASAYVVYGGTGNAWAFDLGDHLQFSNSSDVTRRAVSQHVSFASPIAIIGSSCLNAIGRAEIGAQKRLRFQRLVN